MTTNSKTIEIERKFRLKSGDWRNLAESATRIRQGYLLSGVDAQQRSSIRVRIENDERASLNIKSATPTVRRDEYEYPIPVADAERLLATLCEPVLIEKTRYKVPFAGRIWEIDVFEGDNRGLEIAEIELSHEKEEIPIPAWIGEEVSSDSRFYNNYLLKCPFRYWNE